MRYEVSDGIRPFIEAKMKEYDPVVYTDKDFEVFFSNPHRIFIGTDNTGRILTFGAFLIIEGNYHMCYSWCENTKEGKQAYSTGIDYLINKLGTVYFNEHAAKFNKIKRMINDR